MICSFCNADGQFTGGQYIGPDELLSANTPAGCIAVPGQHDPLCRRYNSDTGAVEPWQPPAPADDDLRTWAWDAAVERWLPVPTLAAHRAAAWARIKAARDAAETAPLTVGLHTFDADPTSQQRIAGAVQMASLAVAAGQGADWAITWTLADNSPVQLSAAQMIDVGMSLATQISSAHARGRLLRAQIDAATDSAQLDLITWSP